MRQSLELTMVNLQSEVTSPFIAAVAEYLCDHAGLSVRFLDDQHWSARKDAFLRGEVDLALLCGLPYVLEADGVRPRCVLLAAPVMASERYRDRPVYFSDVIVHRQAPWQCFADLEGGSWAYNEPSSHSGYALTRFELACRKAPPNFFARVVEAGSHMAAIGLVRAGQVDAAAIDSTVLELATAADPGLANDLRVIATWGPSPMPPLLASTQVPASTRSAVADALLAMHHRPEGRAALDMGLASRFAAVTDSDYDVIRRMAAIAAGYPFGGEPNLL